MKESRPISYSFDDIKRYKNGLMSKEEMHAFEKASMEDPFLADALEGYMQADMPVAEEHLDNIRERITKQEKEREKAVVVSMPKKSFGMLRVAAMVIIVAGAGILTYKIFNKKDIAPDNGPIAQIQQKTVPAGQPVLTDTKGSSASTPAATPEIKQLSRDQNTTRDKARINALNAKKIRSHQKNELAIKDAGVGYDLRKDDQQVNEIVSAPVVNKASAIPVIINNQIRGTIITPSNEPLANTNLRIDNTRKEVKTDNAGNFVVNSKDTVVNAVVTSGSFTNSQVQLRANATSTINIGTIKLKADPNIKLDVEVVDIGTKKRRNDTTNVKPEGGWMSFKEHIAKWLSNPADTSAWDNPQEFEMEFYIDAKGFAQDVKVVNGVNAVVAEQIREAIIQGPKWISRNQKTRLLIRL